MFIGIGITVMSQRGSTFAFLPVEAPTLLTATVISDTRIDLAWTDNTTNEDGYSIERSPDNATWAEIDTVLADVITYSDTTCVAGTLYYYQVRAFKN
jgi:hypothetical protein